MKKLTIAMFALIMAMPTMQALEAQKTITAEEPEALRIRTERIDATRRMLDDEGCFHTDTGPITKHWLTCRSWDWPMALAWFCCCPCLTYHKIKGTYRCPNCGHY